MRVASSSVWRGPAAMAALTDLHGVVPGKRAEARQINVAEVPFADVPHQCEQAVSVRRLLGNAARLTTAAT